MSYIVAARFGPRKVRHHAQTKTTALLLTPLDLSDLLIARRRLGDLHPHWAA